MRVITKMGEDKPVNAARNEGDEYLSMKKGPNDLRTVRELKDALSWKKQRDDQALRATRIEEAKHEIQVTKNFMYIVRVYIFIVVLSYYASNWRHYVSNWTKEVLLTEEQRDSLAFPDYTLAHNRPFPYVYSNNALSLNQNSNETGTGKEKKVSKGDVTELQLVAAGMRKKYAVFNVYATGLYMSPDLILSLNTQRSLTTLVDAYSTSNANHHHKKGKVLPHLGLYLKFQRDVSVDKAVEALREALLHKRDSKSYKASIYSFRTHLHDLIGSDGLKCDDTIEFTFYYSSGNDLGKIAINVYHSETGHRSEVGMVESVELQRRLLSIYTSDKSLVPEIFSIVKKKYLDRLIDEQ